MPKLTSEERNRFLAERGVLMRIATVREDGSPFLTPIWFLHESDSIYFTPRERSEWLEHLRRDPRVALSIDEQPLPYRKVLIEGVAELLHDLGEDDEWRDLYRRIARRYVPDEQAEDYVQSTIDQPRALFRVDLASGPSKVKVRTWRMPVDDEPASGIWHQRYYRPGTLLSDD